jgi:hypothetical protein
VRLRELSFRRVWFRVRYVAGVRGGTGLVRIGRRARFFGSPREGFPILGIVDRDARAIAVRLFRAQDPPGLFGRSRRALGRTSSSSWATLTESSSASDRDTTSTLRAPPSPKWAHTSMSFFALMALGEAITRGAFATARIGSGGIRGTREAADDARGRASLRGAADCDGAANPPEDLPPTFVVALGKTWREFRSVAGRPVVSFGYDNEARSRLVITSFAARGANACPRRLAVAATRPCASTRPRRYVPSLRRRTRATLPSPDRRAKPVVPKSGDADRARPVQKAASCGPRGTDRDEACFPRARLPLRPPRDTSTDAVASRPPRASSVPRDAR